MMSFATAMASLFLLACAGAAQVKEIRYPPLAAAAQVQGEVRLRSGSRGVVLISGHPLLVQAAMASMERLRELSELGDAEIVFHFSLSDTSMREVVYPVKKGDALDRLILHALGFKTEKLIRGKECVENTELPENRIESRKAPVEVWVYGSRRCLMVESAGVVTD